MQWRCKFEWRPLFVGRQSHFLGLHERKRFSSTFGRTVRCTQQHVNLLMDVIVELHVKKILNLELHFQPFLLHWNSSSLLRVYRVACTFGSLYTTWIKLLKTTHFSNDAVLSLDNPLNHLRWWCILVYSYKPKWASIRSSWPCSCVLQCCAEKPGGPMEKAKFGEMVDVEIQRDEGDWTSWEQVSCVAALCTEALKAGRTELLHI